MGTPRSMGIVISLILIAFGAILAWAVNADGGSVDPQVVGVILIVVGLTFFPALAIGPIVEHLAAINGQTF